MRYKKIISQDGTQKLLYKEGYIAVVIPVRGRNTVCVSSQIGCPIGCTFCFTGKLQRNLTTIEIVSQVTDAVAEMEGTLQSVVFMGMGEPMTNFVAVCDAIDRIHEMYSLSYKKITVSTSGVNVDKLLDKKFNAALSLHTLDPIKRKSLIPASLPIPKLLKFAQEYCALHKYGLMIEYALIAGENDTDEDLKRLLDVDWPKNINFNLIEYNEKDSFRRSDRLLIFKTALREAGYKCFIRHSRGQDVEAACGMLEF